MNTPQLPRTDRRSVPPQIPPMPVTFPEETTGVKTDQFARFDAGELFGEGENERTQITTVPFELRPRFTGRRAAIVALEEMFAKARSTGALGFALVIGEPGMGKSRLCT